MSKARGETAVSHISAYSQHATWPPMLRDSCLVKITGDLTMTFPAGITRILTANPSAPVLSFRLVNIARVDHFLPNQKLLYSDPSQSDPDSRDLWFNMQALNNVTLLKYQISAPTCSSSVEIYRCPPRTRAVPPLLLSAECQRSGTVTHVSLDYHCCLATAPATQHTNVQVLMALDHTATDLQCQPPAACWQCLEVPRRAPPSLLVQFVGSGASLSGMDLQLVGSRYRMSLVKKRFATGRKY
ncbi:hypothetical protein AAFF_G00282430 [Aldrovandia affinis]|uniref:MHD domain-containing protein n=1 Tax=Aldrovandia affinis TaxID=143900 RepID=A0AAD7T9T7_9TELE|nr:hypothetical protein AAFF_G00282430 [Aldrovandia affinis]